MVTVGGIPAECDGSLSELYVHRRKLQGEHISDHCKATDMTVPRLYARDEPYDVLIRVDPIGYAILNR